MKLSIIIPFYNVQNYTDELLDRLAPQINEDVEVFVIDDGSDIPFKTKYKWCKVIHKTNGGVSTARNIGLDKATGDYVSFIDADDLVPEYYVEKLIEKSKGGYDVIDFSWKTLGTEGTQHNNVLRNDDHFLTNPSVCTRAFKRSFIGDVRFNTKKDSTEDEDFSRKIGYMRSNPNMKHGAITDYMYFYRTSVENSKVKRYKKGLMNTKRIVYYYPTFTKDMTAIAEEIKKEDETNEVFLLTNRCEIKGLERYCQIVKPMRIWGHCLRGEAWNGFIRIYPPIKTQVVLYTEILSKVGGISTFFYNFCQQMKEYYDITVACDNADPMQVTRLRTIVRVVSGRDIDITCDTLILNRFTDKIPPNITYKKTVHICHACKQLDFTIPKGRDVLVNVSQSSKDTWGEDAKDGKVIKNLSYVSEKQALFLISATRVKVSDKGSNDARMRRLAEMLTRANIPFVWLNFSNKTLDIPHIIDMPATADIQAYMKMASYVVQLSDKEAFCYSLLEALEVGTAVICCPLDVLPEIGVKDGENGYVVPFDMDFDVKKLLNVPKFEYEYDNKPMIEQWREVLGNSVPKHDYTPNKGVRVEVLRQYFDVARNETLTPKALVVMEEYRAKELEDKKLVQIVGEA